MADAIISSVVERLISIADEKIRSEVSLVRGVKKELCKLSEKLKTIRNVLEDANRRGVKDKSVRGWLKKLENTAYEMDDILDEWNYHGIDASAEETSPKKKVCCPFMPSSCLCFKKVSLRRDTAKKIENVKASLDEILKEKNEFNFVISTVPTTDSDPRVQTTSSIDIEKVRGKDVEKNKNDIVRKLVTDGEEQQILSIVGMGGIGKTTLAQLVYNDSRIKSCFDLRIWLCVSDPFDVAGIASGIIEKVEKVKPSSTIQLDVLLEKLSHCVLRKKFFLVLDDVWPHDNCKWEDLRINLKYGAASSKILVTTRNETVARTMSTSDDKIYRPKVLTDEESWSLLRRISLRGREQCGEFEEVGKKIASKCDGLPLAVNVLGSGLQFKNSLEEWENVLKSEIWELDEAGVDLFPHLLLSYNELSPLLKRCFSYCAIYAKDTEIEVESLIQHWMALGYLRYISEGRQCFNNLAMRSLFQDFVKDYSTEQISSCKMHDIVHDFAQSLRKNGGVEAFGLTKRTCQQCNPDLVSHVQEYRSLFYDKKSPPDFCDCLASLRVLGINRMGYYKSLTDGSPHGIEKLIHLRWLDLSWTKLSKKNMKTICKLYCLQTLLLEYCCLEEIPHEIGNLLHLRHLNLTQNEALNELPDNMFNLVELETLLLARCSLEEIPRDIGNLEKLRQLDLSGNGDLEELPDNMSNLVELETLLLAQCSLKEIPREIGDLVKLRKLDLSWNADLEELPDTICRLVKLQSLTLEDCRDCRLPEGLANLNGIRSLGWFYGGSGFNRLGLLKNLNGLAGDMWLSISVSSNSINELVEDAREAELKEKIQLRALEFEFIKERNDEEECPSSLWVNLIEALEPNQSLQTLHIYNYMGSRLPHWISSPLKRVREIDLYECAAVVSLPPMGMLSSLEKLVIRGMKELKVVGVEWLGIRGREGEAMDIQPSSVVAFPKLKRSDIWGCNKWSEWEDITTEEEESSAVSVMPCLTHLTVYNCNGLKMLPHRLLRKAASLEKLNIRESSDLIQRYEDKDGANWRSISENNPQLELQTRF